MKLSHKLAVSKKTYKFDPMIFKQYYLIINVKLVDFELFAHFGTSFILCSSVSSKIIICVFWKDFTK